MAKVSLIDLGKTSTVVAKLIDTVGGAVGTLYEPTKIRRIAKAEGDALIINTQAEIEREDLILRAASRIAVQEVRRQKNVESIVEATVKHLPGEVAEEPVEPDWTARFFDTCQDVSNPELQEIWARLLANEVSSPGACSRRTLSVLRDLSLEDAQLFRATCTFVWYDDKAAFIPLLPLSFDQSQKTRLSFEDGLRLAAAGLTAGQTLAIVELTLPSTGKISYHGRMHLWEMANTAVAKVPIFPLTESGAELRSVCGSSPDEDYYREVLKFLRVRGLRLALPSEPVASADEE